MSIASGCRLELFSAVRTDDVLPAPSLVEEKAEIVVEVLVATTAVHMLVIVFLVPLHLFLSGKGLVAVWKRAFDAFHCLIRFLGRHRGSEQ